MNDHPDMTSAVYRVRTEKRGNTYLSHGSVFFNQCLKCHLPEGPTKRLIKIRSVDKGGGGGYKVTMTIEATSV